MKLNKDKLKKVFSLDNIVDAAVDLFLVLFDVITSPILIVMRMIRWTVGTYVLDGLKNKIKKIIRWVKNKKGSWALLPTCIKQQTVVS